MTDTITTELRESMVDDARGLLYIGETALANLCDAIDAVHANLEAENANLGAELAEWGERGVLLPLDADGVPIRVGDVMENIVCPSVHREVTGVGVECFYGWDDGNGRYSQFDVRCCRHHHAPTVEDVLREFAMEVCGEPALTVRSGVVEEYASRLRLAGES